MGELCHPSGLTRLESGLVGAQCDFRIPNGLTHRKNKYIYIDMGAIPVRDSLTGTTSENYLLVTFGGTHFLLSFGYKSK